jgi:hypothetical protein
MTIKMSPGSAVPRRVVGYSEAITHLNQTFTNTSLIRDTKIRAPVSVEFSSELKIRLSLVPLRTSCTNRIIEVICPLLPPRVFVKSRPIRKMVGRGGGDRTHDLRLKRPLLYH